MNLLWNRVANRGARMASLVALGVALGAGAARADVRRGDFRIDADVREAARAGDSMKLRSLLDKGAKVDARDPETTWTPLMWASRGGHLAAIRVLLARGAQVNARSTGDARSYFPLAQSTRKSATAPPALASGEAPEPSYFRTANSGVTPLLLACAGGWNLSAAELLKKGAQVNARTSSGESALEAAAFRGYLPLVETLLKRGADANARNGRKETPLIVAVKEGHSPVVKRLLAGGADPSAQTSDGYSALVLAKYFGFKDIERLLKSAAPVRPKGQKSAAPKSAPKASPTRGERPEGAPPATGPDVRILN